MIEAVCEKLEKFYVFPELGLKTSQSINKNFEQGKYSDYGIPGEFVQQLSRDLERISNDSHLGIFYDAEMAAQMKNQEKTGEN